MFRSTLIVSILAVLSSAISFLNQLVLARIFGAGAQMDAYLLAISLPLTITGLIGGVLGYQLVPALQQAQVRTGTCGALANSLAAGLGMTALALAVVGMASASYLIHAQNPGLNPAQAVLAASIARVAWLWLPLAVLAAIYTAGLHVRQQFAAATLLQSMPILGSIIVCLLWHQRLGVYAVVWGQLAGYSIMVAGLHIARGSTRAFGSDWSRLKQLFRELPLALAAVLVFVIYPFSDAIWGSRTGQSAVSYLGYAQRLLTGLSGIAVVGATTVIFPRLSRQAAEGNHRELRKNLATSLRSMLTCMTPIAALLGALALPTLQILFQRGAFTLADACMLASLLPSMLVGMMAMSCMGLIFKALFARNEIRTAAMISICGAVAYFILSGLLARRFGLMGIGVAYALSWWLSLGLSLGHLWRHEIGALALRTNLQFAVRLFLAAVLVAGIGWLGAQFLPPAGSPNGFLRLLVLALTGLVSGAAYLVLGNGPLALIELRMITQQMLAMVKRPT